MRAGRCIAQTPFPQSHIWESVDLLSPSQPPFICRGIIRQTPNLPPLSIPEELHEQPVPAQTPSTARDEEGRPSQIFLEGLPKFTMQGSACHPQQTGKITAQIHCNCCQQGEMLRRKNSPMAANKLREGSDSPTARHQDGAHSGDGLVTHCLPEPLSLHPILYASERHKPPLICLITS